MINIKLKYVQHMVLFTRMIPLLKTLDPIRSNILYPTFVPSGQRAKHKIKQQTTFLLILKRLKY